MIFFPSILKRHGPQADVRAGRLLPGLLQAGQGSGRAGRCGDRRRREGKAAAEKVCHRFAHAGGNPAGHHRAGNGSVISGLEGQKSAGPKTIFEQT